MKWFGVLARGSSESALMFFGALLLVSACTTDHDALARKPQGGASNGGSSGSGLGGSGNTGDVPSQGGRNNPDTEPSGDNVLTIVNGIADAPGVALCFARTDESGEIGEPIGDPLAEIGYGASRVLREIDGFSFADDALVPWALAGELQRIEGLSCADAVALALAEEAKVTPESAAGEQGAGGQGAGGQGAGGQGASGGEPAAPLEMPTLRARALGAIPPGTVNIGRSILMVLSGCIGGAYYTDKLETSVCGDDYTRATPTVQPVVVKLSREISFDKIGLQAVHASRAVPGTIGVRVAGEGEAVSLTFASGLAFGGVEPRPADTRFGASELGLGRRDYGLQAVDDRGVIFEAAWSDVYETSGVDALEPLRGYTAILVGPNPLLVKKGWWNSPAFTLIDNDPTRMAQ